MNENLVKLRSAWKCYRFFVVFVLHSESQKVDYITQYFNGVLILNINLGWNMQQQRVGKFNGFAIKWFPSCFWLSAFQGDELIYLESTFFEFLHYSWNGNLPKNVIKILHNHTISSNLHLQLTKQLFKTRGLWTFAYCIRIKATTL